MGRTLKDIRASGPRVDRAKIAAIGEADIARHAAEDGESPDSTSDFVKRRPGERGGGKRPAKEQVTLRVDPATLAAWRASGDGWMSRAAEVLAREAPRLENKAVAAKSRRSIGTP